MKPIIKRILSNSWKKWLLLIKENILKTGTRSVFGTIISFLILYNVIPREEFYLEAIIFFSVIIGTTAANLLVFIWLLFSEPIKIIVEQEKIINALQEGKKYQEVIGRLTEQREIGVKLRNNGEGLLSEDSIKKWWIEFEGWRETTSNVIALLDENRARKFLILDTYSPKRPFVNALSSAHRHKLQMFDAWLERLKEEIDYWEHKINY